MLKRVYGYWLSLLTTLFGIDFAKKFDTYLRFRRKLNLKHPQTLADKVCFLFLHKATPLMSICADKWAVRNYVKEKGLEDILIPTIDGPWSSVQEIDFETLPEKFILKATHGCKMNYLVPEKSKLNTKQCKRTLQKWLNTTYGIYSLEPHYQQIPHRIYAEKLLGTSKGLIDYKIHCLNGIPQFVLVCSDRKFGVGRMQVVFDLFDTQWNCLNQFVQRSGLETKGVGDISKPQNLVQMLDISKKLSEEFSFVRIDLYEVNKKIYFGEMTFSPACGIFPYFVNKFVKETGKNLTITEVQND